MHATIYSKNQFFYDPMKLRVMTSDILWKNLSEFSSWLYYAQCGVLKIISIFIHFSLIEKLNFRNGSGKKSAFFAVWMAFWPTIVIHLLNVNHRSDKRQFDTMWERENVRDPIKDIFDVAEAPRGQELTFGLKCFAKLVRCFAKN